VTPVTAMLMGRGLRGVATGLDRGCCGGNGTAAAVVLLVVLLVELCGRLFGVISPDLVPKKTTQSEARGLAGIVVCTVARARARVS